ncbi:hypothetical protein HOLleu_35743 [Holothuria leucospilota]|uniref:Uncharacterized protein n=1 Tax=Holothuria leucospilota TaxID=206669 RepID=A0A9Q0YJC5_HOLLE|nr:hypothetical protein HOLleu_35743 [Holothuria leucospilota]
MFKHGLTRSQPRYKQLLLMATPIDCSSQQETTKPQKSNSTEEDKRSLTIRCLGTFAFRVLLISKQTACT